METGREARKRSMVLRGSGGRMDSPTHSHIVDKNWKEFFNFQQAIPAPGQTAQPRVPAPGR